MALQRAVDKNWVENQALGGAIDIKLRAMLLYSLSNTVTLVPS